MVNVHLVPKQGDQRLESHRQRLPARQQSQMPGFPCFQGLKQVPDSAQDLKEVPDSAQDLKQVA